MAEFPVSDAVLDAATLAHEQWHLDNDGDPDAVYWPSHQDQTRAVLNAAGPLLLAERLRTIAGQLAEAGPWLAARRVSPEGSACVAVAAIRADMLRAADELEGAVVSDG